MTWAHSAYLWLLLVAGLAVPLSAWAWSRRSSDLRKLVSAAMLDQLVSPGTASSRTLQAVLVPLVLAALAVALAGPRMGFDWQQQKMEGVSIVAVLDVSRSMDATDSSPSRIVVAKRELVDFSGMLRGDAIGLVLFAQGAWTRIPLTTDYATWRWALDDTSTSTIRAQGTSLSGALDAAVKLLDRADGSGKAVLLVSDGEDHDEDAELTAALSRTREANVHVFVLGVGTPEGAPVPMEDGGLKKDEDGSVVVSKLDEPRLKGLAEATGGAYVRAVPGDDDVRGLYEQEIRGKLTASERGVRRDKLWHERFQWPLGVALAAMVLGAALGIRRR